MKAFFLEPISGGVFFVFEDFGGEECGDFGRVPGGELCRVITDYCDQVVITLGMDLYVGEELLDGGVAQGFDGELQTFDALLRGGDNRGSVNDAEAVGSKNEVE